MIALAWPFVALVAIGAASFFAWRLLPASGLRAEIEALKSDAQTHRTVTARAVLDVQELRGHNIEIKARLLAREGKAADMETLSARIQKLELGKLRG